MVSQKHNQTQHDEFVKVAREIGADESDDALDRIMGKLDLTKKPAAQPDPVNRKDQASSETES